MLSLRVPLAVTAVPILVSAALLPERTLSRPAPIDRGEWHDYAGDSRGMKYSPLDQIHAGNVSKLRIAWRWRTADGHLQLSDPAMRGSRYEDTPLMANGVLYTVTPLGFVAALDPETGVPRWVYDTRVATAGRPHGLGHIARGLMYWSDGTRERLYHAGNDAFLYSIDAKTGTLDLAFGDDGKVDIVAGLRRAERVTNISGRRGVVTGDVVIVGSTIKTPPMGADEEAPPGEVRAYDARSGKHLWTFHLVPQEGEFGYETWLEMSAERTGNANAWAGMAYDKELDYVYVPTSNPGNDYFGAMRPGDNLFGESLVCLEANTGKRVWHFQAHHHGLWDYDFPMHPALGEVMVDGMRVKAVMIANKTNFIYAFDRKTGRPLWPIDERPVPQATTKNGEVTSPTQPFPTKPPAIGLRGSLPENLIDFTPELKASALENLQQFEHGPLFTPPSDRGTLVVPSEYGGPNLGGGAFDPESGIYYVPTRFTASIHRAGYPSTGDAGIAGRRAGPERDRSSTSFLTLGGLPIFKPPYASVAAVDMNRGEIVWQTPIGSGPRHHPLLAGLTLPPLGDAIQGAGPLVTKTLLFVAVTNLFGTGRPTPPVTAKFGDPGWERKLLYVFDKRSGAIVHVVEMDGLGMSTPMTYLHRGKQYIVVATGARENSELVALSLP